MAQFCCTKCDHEDHYVAFVVGTNPSGEDFEDDDEDPEVELQCPACGADSGIVEL